MLCKRDKDKPMLVIGRCCCLKLRTGLLIIALLEIIITLMHLGYHIAGSIDHPYYLYNLNMCNASLYFSNSSDKSLLPEPDYSASVLPTILTSLTDVVHLVISFILVYGAWKERLGIVKIWMAVRCVNVLDNTVDVISLGPLRRINYFNISIWIVFSLITIFFVRSYIINFPKKGELIELPSHHEPPTGNRGK